MGNSQDEIQWKDEPEAHDYRAAFDYLSLIIEPEQAAKIVRYDRWRKAKHPVKDIMRASGVRLLDAENDHVQKDLDKIDAGEKLSPVLLVRGIQPGQLTIADGYHRCVAAYLHNEDSIVEARISDA